MGIQTPLLVIDRRERIPIMSGVIPNRRVAHLRVDDSLNLIGYRRENREGFRNGFGTYPMEFGGRRNDFRSQNKFDNMYLILINLIND